MNLIRFSSGIVHNMEMLHSIEPQSDGTIRLAFSSSGAGFLLYRRMDIDLVNAWIAEQGSDPEPTQEMIDAGLRAWYHTADGRDNSGMRAAYNAMCAKRRER